MPGAVPRALGIGSAPAGKQRLHAVALRHGAGCGGRTSPGSASNDSAWKTSSTPATVASDLAGQVVLRRAEAAGGEDQAGPPRGDAEGGDVVVEVVGDGGVPADGDADLGQPPAEPLAVGVEVLAAGQLAADGEDFGFHYSWSSTIGLGDGTLQPPNLFLRFIGMIRRLDALFVAVRSRTASAGTRRRCPPSTCSGNLVFQPRAQ